MLGQGVMFSLWLLFNEFETGFVPFLSTPHPCTRRASFQSAQVGPEARPQLGALSTPERITEHHPLAACAGRRGDSEQYTGQQNHLWDGIPVGEGGRAQMP